MENPTSCIIDDNRLEVKELIHEFYSVPNRSWKAWTFVTLRRILVTLAITRARHARTVLTRHAKGVKDVDQGCALRKFSGSPSGSQPCQVGCPAFQVGRPK